MAATRRLAAILAADVVGYSRLMGADEEGTLERLKALRREFVDPKIAEHNGRVVKTTSDGLLVEFASVVDAVRRAVAMQQAIWGLQPDAPRRMLYIDPVLPPWLGDLTLRDLRVGDQVFDIGFERSGEETRFEVLKGDPACVVRREVVAWSALLNRTAEEPAAREACPQLAQEKEKAA